ncbi:MAG TPA: hypothetical protein VG652_04530 [Gaiellaceae bacterium]|nr:hypothetical protein [Gaiellaceae bacterium]
MTTVRWRDRVGLAALAGYCAVSFLFFGLRLLLESGRQYIGQVDDPQIPIWSFAWWPHAILHGENPFYTHAVWAPDGLNLTWTNANAGPAILFAPLTWAVGPVASYNVAALLAPAVSAWAAFLLCRHLTNAIWPSLVGGYIFGFSSYVLGHIAGELQLTAIFAIPLIALVIVRYVEGALTGRGLALRLGVLLAVQLLFGLELAFTASLALLCGLIIAFAFVPDWRRRLRSMLVPLAGAYALAAVLTSPFLYYALTGGKISAFIPPVGYRADLLNIFLPTNLEAVGAGWAHTVVDHFPGNYTERGAFVGPAVLVIVALFAWRRWRSPVGRFLLVSLLVTIYGSLGSELTVYGHTVFPLLTPFGHETLKLPGLGTTNVPLFNNTLPVRFMMYASLICAVIVALWTAARPAGARVTRWGLPALAVLALVPNPYVSTWATTFSIPSFFTSSAYRSCLPPNAIVLPEPVGQSGEAILWQAANGFHFGLAGGRLTTSPPTTFMHPTTLQQISVGNQPVPDQTPLLRAYIQAKHVTNVIVDKRQSSIWAPALNRIATPQDVGGVLLYDVGGRSLPCTKT